MPGGLGVFQLFSVPGGDTSGFIPYAGTETGKTVFGDLKISDAIKWVSDSQPENYLQVNRSSGEFYINSYGDLIIEVGYDGFGEIVMRTHDGGSQFYVQSGGGGLFGQSIDQVYFNVDNGAGGTAFMVLNPNFFEIKSQGTNASGTLQSGQLNLNADDALTIVGASVGHDLTLGTNDTQTLVTLSAGGSSSWFSQTEISINTYYVGASSFSGLDITGSDIALSTTAGSNSGSLQITSGQVVFGVSDGVNNGSFGMDVTGSFLESNNTFISVNPETPGTTPGSITFELEDIASAVHDFSIDDTGFQIQTIGDGISIAEGSNATMGLATLVTGSKVVNTSKVTANSRILLTAQNSSGTAGSVYVSARTVGTSFTITSTSALDSRNIAWIILNPL